MMPRRILGFALAIVCCTVPALADDVLDQLKKAGDFYQAGHYGKAAEELRWALTVIETKQGEQLAKYLPAGPEGFTASSPETTNLPGGGSQTSRTYTKGDSQLTLEMNLNSPLVQSMGMLFASPFFMNQPNSKPLQVKGERAVQEFQADGKEGKITLLLGGKLLITVEGEEIESPDAMAALANQLDIAALKKEFIE